MALPEIVDIVRIKRWTPKLRKNTGGCFLYDWKSLGIAPDQFVDVIAGRSAILFEKPFTEKVRAKNCPWCEFKATGKDHIGSRFRDHIFTHPRKTLLSHQLVKFSQEMYSLRLQLVRKGYHEALGFFVEHSCQDCPTPVVEGRNGMCALPVSSRPRMRSLNTMGYPIKHLVENKKRKYAWSALGVIVLIRTEVTLNKDLKKLPFLAGM